MIRTSGQLCFIPVAAILLASIPSLALAQQPSVERRIGKLEAEMRALQRKVFPGGNVEPEIRPEPATVQAAGVQADTAVADLSARLDSLEAQLAGLTRNTEEEGSRLRQIEERLTAFRAEFAARLDAFEAQSAAAAQPKSAPAAIASSNPATATRRTGDAGEDAYLNGFGLWEQKRFADAETALEAMAKAHPRHRRASWALNLAGRAALDDGRPAAAAKILLANYHTHPKGERAADSLYYLGQAMMKLGKRNEACQAYAELQDVFGSSMRDFLKQNLPKARAAAKCK